jgi:nitrile hydratase
VAISHHHDHDHDNHFTPIEARVKALESLMVEKGYVDPAALDAIIETYETKCRPAQRRPRRRQSLERSRPSPRG